MLPWWRGMSGRALRVQGAEDSVPCLRVEFAAVRAEKEQAAQDCPKSLLYLR